MSQQHDFYGFIGCRVVDERSDVRRHDITYQCRCRTAFLLHDTQHDVALAEDPQQHALLNNGDRADAITRHQTDSIKDANREVSSSAWRAQDRWIADVVLVVQRENKFISRSWNRRHERERLARVAP